MNEKLIFVRTESGDGEARGRTALLSKDIKRALMMVDGTASVAEIMKRSSPSLRGMLQDMFLELARGGFIQDKSKVSSLAKLVAPHAPVASPKKPDAGIEELDFTAAFRVPTSAMMAEEAAKLSREKARVEAQAQVARQKTEEEVARVKAEQAALEKAQIAAREEAARVEQKAAEKARVLEAERIEAAARQAEARARAEEQAKRDAEVARVKAESARVAHELAERVKAEAARVVAQERTRLEAEVARLKAAAEAEAQAHARQEIEAAKRLASEEAARVVAQERARLEAEAARLKAQADAEAHARQEIEAAKRLAAEEAARVREELERERAAAREQTARQVREAAEVARIKAEQEAAKAALRAEAERHEAAEAKLKAEQHAAQVQAEADVRALALAQERAKLEAEVSQLKADARTDERRRVDTLARLEAETVKAQQASERLLREAEARRIKAEEEISLVRRETEQQLLQAREEAAREHAEKVAAQRGAQVELISPIPDEDASKLVPDDPVLAAVVRLNAKHADEERNVVSALDELTQAAAAAASRDSSQWVVRSDSAPATDRRQAAPAVPGCDSRGGNNGVPVVERRTTTAAVLFFDIVGYTKLSDQRQISLKQQFSQLVGNSLDPLDAGERIILDTGDGAAIGFLQHPTDALESAIHFRAGLTANSHFDYPDLRVRLGIHLGPVSLVKDMNGQINMLGDGINSAQRVMSFAGHDQIYVSRAYFEFVSNLSDEYKDLFRYRGAQQDKHGREHQIYELIDANAEVVSPQPEILSSEGFEGFDLDAFDLEAPAEAEVLMPEMALSPQLSAADQLLLDAAKLELPPIVAPVEAIAATVAPIAAQSEVVAEYSEQEAKQLADAQAKKWREAESRAAEDARKPVPPPQAAPEPVVRLPRVPRKPKPWGKLAAGLAVALVATLFALPAVMPTQSYLANIEQTLSAKLQQPVHIGRLSARILPAPRLILSEVSIGATRQIQADQAQVNFAYSALFGATRAIDSLNLEGVRVKDEALLQVAGWLQQTASDAHYPVARIGFTEARLESDSVPLSGVGGEVDFDASGHFTEAKLNADGHKLVLELHAGPKLPFSLTLRDRALPLFPDWIFEDLKANGELSQDEMRISDLDGRIRGGVLTGDARINWREGWRVQGALEAKVIPLQNINKLLGGDLDGTARFQMQSGRLAKLADTAVLNGVFNVNKGIVNGVDVVETARFRSRENLPGGRTHFEAMSGELNYANDLYRFSQLKINDSVVKAAGTLAVNRQKLSGMLSADLSMRAGTVMLQVEGTTASPALHVAH